MKPIIPIDTVMMRGGKYWRVFAVAFGRGEREYYLVMESSAGKVTSRVPASILEPEWDEVCVRLDGNMMGSGGEKEHS